MVWATTAGFSLPSISSTPSSTTRTPSSLAFSALAIDWRRRTREPTGTIEVKRKEYVGPLNEHVRTVNEAFKGFVLPLIEADRILKEKVGVYRAEQERVRKAEEEINRKRQEAAQEEMVLKGELTESVGLVEVTPERSGPYRGQTANLIGKKVWRFEVEDFAKLPDDFKEPNLVKIRSVVIAMKQEGYAIPGVRAWHEEELAVTPRMEKVTPAPVAAITEAPATEAPVDAQAFPDPDLPF